MVTAQAPQKPRSMTLLICAATRITSLSGLLMVCGRAPGHEPPHRDAVWPVAWNEPSEGEQP